MPVNVRGWGTKARKRRWIVLLMQVTMQKESVMTEDKQMKAAVSALQKASQSHATSSNA